MEEDIEYIENSWSYLLLCVEPTLLDGLKFAKDLIIINIVLRCLLQYIPMPHIVRHSISFIFGCLLLFINIGANCVWTLALTIGTYFAIIFLSIFTLKKRGVVVSFAVIVYLFSCEIFSVNPKIWQQIRGIQMIAAMKIISVAIDLDRGLFKALLNPVEFCGYVMCPANCILGPWISYHNYNEYLNLKFIKIRWLKIIFCNLCISMLFLVLSSCIIPWYINDDMPKWVVAYRDAQAFRMSHYFISCMSIVSMASAGFGLTNDCHLETEITKPYYIELPRSLVQVVIYWNMPMHQWLKFYIFKSCQPYGKFLAIIVTYGVSSLLHGLNFQLSSVLLSIGTFSYVEYNLRLKIAYALEVCCLANPCIKQCDHKYKNKSILALIINFLFSLLALIHLTYLGVMFEASISIQEAGYSFFHTLSKWEHLNYFSHSIVAFMYIAYLMM